MPNSTSTVRGSLTHFAELHEHSGHLLELKSRDQVGRGVNGQPLLRHGSAATSFHIGRGNTAHL